MATQTFTFNSGTGGSTQDSTAITIGAGESVRVRFSEFSGEGDAFLVITANSVTTVEPINTRSNWVSGAVASGDSVLVRARLYGAGTGRIAGIVAGFS